MVVLGIDIGGSGIKGAPVDVERGALTAERHRIPTPQFAVFRRGRKPLIPRRLRYPLFVKSATEDASLGIAQASVVDDEARLRERIGFIHEQTHSDALVEELMIAFGAQDRPASIGSTCLIREFRYEYETTSGETFSHAGGMNPALFLHRD